MKINRLRTFVVGLAIAAVAFTQYGCEQEWQKKHDPAVLKAPATVQLAVSDIEDSTAVVSYTQSVLGQLYVVLVPGDDEVAVPAQNSVLRLNAAGAVYTKQIFVNEDADKTGSLTIGGLNQNTSYKVFALPVNTDGVLGEVTTTEAFTTSDVYDPEFVSSSPAAANTANKAPDFDVTVTFDEPVVINDEEGIFFTYYNPIDGTFAKEAADVKIEAGKLVAKQTHEPIFGQYVFLTIEEEAIKDRAGNFFEGIESGIDAGKLVGLYWRVEYMPYAVQDTLPAEGEPVQDLDFKVELTYELPMDFYRGAASAVVYDNNDIIFDYATATTTISVKVPQANVSFADEVVTITPPRTPVYGETVTVRIAEGAYRTVYGSPNAEVELSWLISYGYKRDLVLGDYTITAAFEFDGAGWVASDFATTAEIIAHPTDANKVLISGFLGATNDIVAIFNGDFATFTIPEDENYPGWGQMLEFSEDNPLYGKELELWNRVTDTGVFTGSIDGEGKITLGAALSFYDYTAGAWWKTLNVTTWVKASSGKFNTSDSSLELENHIIVDKKRARR
ncbi:hypothetical protein [Perlabentimonas gracilis]|uniref:hypothetical protein n=1 Tax=Perlabentimonas gracilis TaxID=2715279 RepID=UPI00140E2FD4|nr:hypothetical protein [Perlabentimonas gracilis]NHB70160.1 hypothetical protein [Perlabentimonas gracilis]